jgi:hypothetical protein
MDKNKTIIAVLKEFYSEENHECLSIKPEEEHGISKIRAKIIPFTGLSLDTNVVETKKNQRRLRLDYKPKNKYFILEISSNI